MRYVPNLIPAEHKVLKKYFKGDIYAPRKTHPALEYSSWVLGVILLAIGIHNINHPLLFLPFMALGLIILPASHRWLEKKMVFRITNKMKLFISTAVLIVAFPLTDYYQKIDKYEANQLEIKRIKEENEKKEIVKKEKDKKDKLNFYIKRYSDQIGEHKIDKSIIYLDSATIYASTLDEKKYIADERIKISFIEATDLVKKKKYSIALTELNSLIDKNSNNATLHYNRAICYSKTGKIREAIIDCKIAIQLGDQEANQLYQKLNPLKKRISYYVTRCCDGTSSSAKGRGACSHHGGVCNWNDPIYEEYRKYE